MSGRNAREPAAAARVGSAGRPFADGSDTIVALSTPPGEGALAVVRLSGPGAIPIADRVFRGARPLSEAPAGSVRLGRILDAGTGERIDQVLATVLRAPRSYTGEDTVEISGHGGSFVSRRIVEALIDAGARPATPGEFTRRAFLNGRIDLAQAEAVADLIHARGERAARNALAQVEGGLTARLSAITDRILDVLAPLEAFIDFGDDVPEPPGRDAALANIARALSGLDALLGERERARLIEEGVTVAIVGRPNVGKSSLLNALAGCDRALVHDAPGTTRDTIDVTVSVEGIPLRLVDTAGIRGTPDPVESAGVERSFRALDAAHLTLMVIDGSAPPTDDDAAVAARLGDRPAIVVRNKSDLGDDAASRRFAEERGRSARAVSALTGEGLPELIRDVLEEAGFRGGEEGVLMTRARHYDVLARARGALGRAERAFHEHAFADMIAQELREALGALGEISGKGVGAEVLDRIFATFCIGK